LAVAPNVFGIVDMLKQYYANGNPIPDPVTTSIVAQDVSSSSLLKMLDSLQQSLKYTLASGNK
jgi:hypothetical protein